MSVLWFFFFRLFFTVYIQHRIIIYIFLAISISGLDHSRLYVAVFLTFKTDPTSSSPNSEHLGY